MLVIEAAFGILGLVAAPIYFAHTKDEWLAEIPFSSVAHRFSGLLSCHAVIIAGR